MNTVFLVEATLLRREAAVGSIQGMPPFPYRPFLADRILAHLSEFQTKLQLHDDGLAWPGFAQNSFL